MRRESMDPWDSLLDEDDSRVTTRTPRSLETRELSLRADSYEPPGVLPNPLPQAGYTFRWIRSSNRGVEDKTHYQKRYREGWRPVMAEDHPEVAVEVGFTMTTGIVEVGGLILAKMPTEKVRQRQAYYQRMSDGEADAEQQRYLADNHEHMEKVYERKTSFGRLSA